MKKLLLLLVLLVGCTTTSNTNSTGIPSGNVVNANIPVSASVDIRSLAFTPNALTVRPGTTVTWTQNDAAPHTITSDNGLFDSWSISNGAIFSFKFNTPGTFNYHCSIHPNMKGTIIVRG